MKISVRKAISQAIDYEMVNDNNVFIVGEEVGEYQGAYKVTEGLLQKFGSSRVVDTPISEHGFTGLAIGAAFYGLKPIVEFMSFNFSMQAFDQIVNSAAKTCYMSGGQISCPIVFRGPNGAASRVAAQHSQNFAALYSHIPGLKVIAPYDAEDTRGLLISAIRDLNPVIFLENEILYNKTFEVSNTIVPIALGKSKLRKIGNDVTVVTFSLQVELALNASAVLMNEGISVEVLDLRCIKPLDLVAIIESVKKTNKLVILEEGWFFSGIGVTIAAMVSKDAFDYLDAPVEIVSSKSVPLPYAENLEKLALPSLNDLLIVIRKICNK